MAEVKEPRIGPVLDSSTPTTLLLEKAQDMHLAKAKDPNLELEAKKTNQALETIKQNLQSEVKVSQS